MWWAALISNKKLIMPLLGILVAASIFAYIKYQSILINAHKEAQEQQKETIVNLENSLKESNKSIDKLITINNDLVENTQKAVQKLDDLRKTNEEVSRQINAVKTQVSDARLRSLAEVKPGLIEIKVNKATEKTFKQIEEETK